MGSLALGFVGGIIAWFAATLIGELLRKFFQLRHETAIALATFDDHWASNPDDDPPSDEWFEQRKETFEKIGVALIGFGASNVGLNRILRSKKCQASGAFMPLMPARI